MEGGAWAHLTPEAPLLTKGLWLCLLPLRKVGGGGHTRQGVAVLARHQVGRGVELLLLLPPSQVTPGQISSTAGGADKPPWGAWPWGFREQL